MRTFVVFSVALAGLLSCLMLSSARAQDAQASSSNNQGPGFTSDPLDPVVELQRIRARRAIAQTRSSLFGTSPLTPLRECWLDAENRLNEETGIKFGTSFNHLFQRLSESLPGEDKFGFSTNMTLVGACVTLEAPSRGS